MDEATHKAHMAELTQLQAMFESSESRWRALADQPSNDTGFRKGQASAWGTAAWRIRETIATMVEKAKDPNG